MMLLELRFAASDMINDLHTIVAANPFTALQRNHLHGFIDDRHQELNELLRQNTTTAEIFNAKVAEVGELLKLYIDALVHQQ